MRHLACILILPLSLFAPALYAQWTTYDADSLRWVPSDTTIGEIDLRDIRAPGEIAAEALVIVRGYQDRFPNDKYDKTKCHEIGQPAVHIVGNGGAFRVSDMAGLSIHNNCPVQGSMSIVMDHHFNEIRGYFSIFESGVRTKSVRVVMHNDPNTLPPSSMAGATSFTAENIPFGSGAVSLADPDYEDHFRNIKYIPGELEIGPAPMDHHDVIDRGGAVLFSAYPNPFNPMTTIPFTLSQYGHVRIVVYNMLGAEIAVLTDRMYSQGRHEVRFDGSVLPSGTYMYNMQANGKFSTRKIMHMVK